MKPEEKLDLYSRILVQEFRQELHYATAIHEGRASRREDRTDLPISIASSALQSLISEIPVVGSALAAGTDKVVGYLNEKRHQEKSEKTAFLQYNVHEDALGVLIEQVAKETARRYQYFITQRLSSKSEIHKFAAVGARRMLKYYSDQKSKPPFSEEILLQGLIFADTSLMPKTSLKDSISISSDINADGAYSHCAVQCSTGDLYSFASDEKRTKISTDAHGNSAAKYGFVNLPLSDRLFGSSRLQELKDDHSGSNQPLQRSMQEYQPTWITIDYRRLCDYAKQHKESSLLEYCKKHLNLPNATQLFYVPNHAADHNEKVLTSLNFAGKDLSFCDFRGCSFGGSLNNTRFVASNLYEVDFNKVSSMEGSNFKDANMEKLNAKGKRFNHCDFRGAQLFYANIEGSTISGGYDSSTVLPKVRNYELSALHPVKLVDDLRSRFESKQAQTNTDLIKINERLQQQAIQLQKLNEFFSVINKGIRDMSQHEKTSMPGLHSEITQLKVNLKQQQEALNKNIIEIQRLMSQAQERGVSQFDLDLQISKINSKLRVLQQSEEKLRQTALGYCELIYKSTQENIVEYRSTLEREQASDKSSRSDSIGELIKRIASLEDFKLVITRTLNHFEKLQKKISQTVEHNRATFPPKPPVEEATQASSFDVTRHQDTKLNKIMAELSQQRQDSERRQVESEQQKQELVDQLRQLKDEFELFKKDQVSQKAAVESSQGSISRSPKEETKQFVREKSTSKRQQPHQSLNSSLSDHDDRLDSEEPPVLMSSFDEYEEINPSINYKHVLFALGLCGNLDDELSSYFTLEMETDDDVLDSHSYFDHVKALIKEKKITFNDQNGTMWCSQDLQKTCKKLLKEMRYSEKVNVLCGIAGAFGHFCEENPDHVDMIQESMEKILGLIGENLIKPVLIPKTSTKPVFFSHPFDGNSDLKDVKELLKMYFALISINLFFYKNAENAGKKQTPLWGDDPQSLTCWLAAKETVNAYFKCSILSPQEKDFYLEILETAMKGVFPGSVDNQQRLD